jgi:2-polyprenyl-3-methyl-5-hydroxy-6-metoxy-1,4-benzoquinol methylase
MVGNREFLELRRRSSNPLNSGLTELNAATAVDNGFMGHNDWMAHCARYGYAAKIITKYAVRSILDYGCGSLQLPYYLWRNRQSGDGINYWGVDLRADEDWLGKVGWSASLTLVRADLILDDLDDLPNFPGTFDLTVCTEVFEHVPIECQQELLDKLYSYTKPNGFCIFSTPNAAVSDSTADNHIGPDGISRERVFEDKIRMAERAGFQVGRTYGTFCGARRVESHILDLTPLNSVHVSAYNDHPSSDVLRAAKEFLPHGWYTVFIAAAFPERSNNALFLLHRPLSG